MSWLDTGDENALVSDNLSTCPMTPRSKMGFLRTPLGDLKNKFGGKAFSDTPQRKSAKKDKTDLLALNLQLETSNKIQRDEIRSLESRLAIEKSTIQKQETMIKGLVQKCEGLEKSLQSPHSYYHQFKRAQQIIFELHGENRQFEGLMVDFESTAQLQSRLQAKLAEAAERFLVLSKDDGVVNKLKSDIAQLQEHCEDCHKKLSVAAEEKKEMSGDIKLMQSLLMQSNNSLSELDEKWHTLHNEIKKDKDRIHQLGSDKTSIAQAFNVMMTEKVKTEEELHQCKSKMEKMKLHKEDNQEKMELYIQNLQHTLDSWEVDREVAEEEITELRRELISQQQAMEEMEVEMHILRENRQKCVDLQSQIEELQSTNSLLEDEKDFFTTAITDYRMKLEAELELTKSNQSLIAALKSSNDELQCTHEQLQMDHYSLQEELCSVHEQSETLVSVLEHIHENVEQTLANLQQFFDVKLKLVTGPPLQQTIALRTTLRLHKYGLEAEAKQRLPQSPQPERRQSDRRSLVKDILSVAKNQESVRKNRQPDGKEASLPPSALKSTGRKKSLRQDNVDYGSSQKSSSRQRVISHSESLSVTVDGEKARVTSRRCLKFGRRDVSAEAENLGGNPPELQPSPSRESEQVVVTETCRTPQSESEEEVDVEKVTASSPGFAVIRDIPSSSDKNLSMVDCRRSAELRESNDDFIEQCYFVMDSVKGMLAHMVRTGQVVAKASRLGMRDLEGEIELLQEELSLRNERVQVLERDLQAKTEEMDKLKAEMRELGQRVSSMTKAILKHEDLGYDVKRLEEEKEDWMLREKRLTGEIGLLSQQLDTVVSQADEKHGKTKDGTCLREIVALRKKNYQLECQIYEEMQRSKLKESKVSRRLQVTEDNWQKAEEEVKDLDEIIQTIRKKCIETHTSHKHPAILNIIRLIDGNSGDNTSLTFNQSL